MSRHAGIYLRNGQVIVIPEGGGGGYYFTVEPIHVVSPEPSAIAKAIEEAFAIAASAEPPPDSAVRRKPQLPPTLKKLGARSFIDFYRGASHCFLYDEDDRVIMFKWIPAADGRGFEMAPGNQTETITDRSRLGEIVLEYLENAPKAV